MLINFYISFFFHDFCVYYYLMYSWVFKLLWELVLTANIAQYTNMSLLATLHSTPIGCYWQHCIIHPLVLPATLYSILTGPNWQIVFCIWEIGDLVILLTINIMQYTHGSLLTILHSIATGSYWYSVFVFQSWVRDGLLQSWKQK